VGCAGSSLARHCSTSIQESIHNVWIAAGVVDSMAWVGGLGKKKVLGSTSVGSRSIKEDPVIYP
jgi:hypothetical protein